MSISGKRFRWVTVVVFALGIALAVWFSRSSLAGSSPPAYETTTARRGDIEVTISAAGTLTPKEMVEVGAQVSGQLQTLFVDVGDEVEKGQYEILSLSG